MVICTSGAGETKGGIEWDVPFTMVDFRTNLFQQMDEKTSDTNQAKSETSPIHLAAFRGNMAICRLLLNESENKNPYSKQGLTTLHYAALAGHLEVYQLFYESAVIKNPKIVKTGQTPLHLSSAEGHLEVTTYLEVKVW